jgi:folate-dependent tRNA-U54 methylase TrmFO/GidA
MKHEANKDQNLVNFLKQNQPFPSCSNQHQEEQLIAMICSGNIRSSWAKNRSLLLFSILTVLGLLLILARLEKNNVLPQIANE